MPHINEEVQREVEERTGTQPCIWQIEVVCMVLEGKDVITIAALAQANPCLTRCHSYTSSLVLSIVIISSSIIDILE